MGQYDRHKIMTFEGFKIFVNDEGKFFAQDKGGGDVATGHSLPNLQNTLRRRKTKNLTLPEPIPIFVYSSYDMKSGQALLLIGFTPGGKLCVKDAQGKTSTLGRDSDEILKPDEMRNKKRIKLAKIAESTENDLEKLAKGWPKVNLKKLRREYDIEGDDD